MAPPKHRRTIAQISKSLQIQAQNNAPSKTRGEIYAPGNGHPFVAHLHVACATIPRDVIYANARTPIVECPAGHNA